MEHADAFAEFDVEVAEGVLQGMGKGQRSQRHVGRLEGGPAGNHAESMPEHVQG